MHRIWTTVLLLASLGTAQKAPEVAMPQGPEGPALVPLHTSSINPTQIPGFTFWGDAQCDAKGYLYFRIGTSFNETAVLRVSPDGNEHEVFSMPAEYQDKTAFVTFRTRPNGEISALVETKEGLQVFSWKPTSQEAKHTTLATPEHISPLNFAVFNNGTILLSGYYNKDAPEAQHGKSYLAEFEPSGRLKMTFDGYMSVVDVSGKKPRVDAGAAVDERGYMYVVRGDRLLVMSDAGEIVSDFAPPKPSPDFRMTHVQAVKGRVGVWFMKNESQRITLRLGLVDAQAGEVLRMYEPDAELGNNSLCFTGDAFTFFRVKDGYVRFLTASVR